MKSDRHWDDFLESRFDQFWFLHGSEIAKASFDTVSVENICPFQKLTILHRSGQMERCYSMARVWNLLLMLFEICHDTYALFRFLAI